MKQYHNAYRAYIRSLCRLLSRNEWFHWQLLNDQWTVRTQRQWVWPNNEPAASWDHPTSARAEDTRAREFQLCRAKGQEFQLCRAKGWYPLKLASRDQGRKKWARHRGGVQDEEDEHGPDKEEGVREVFTLPRLIHMESWIPLAIPWNPYGMTFGWGPSYFLVPQSSWIPLIPTTGQDGFHMDSMEWFHMDSMEWFHMDSIWIPRIHIINSKWPII